MNASVFRDMIPSAFSIEKSDFCYRNEMYYIHLPGYVCLLNISMILKESLGLKF